MFNSDLLCMKCMMGMVAGGYCNCCGSPVITRQPMDHVLPLGTILNGKYLVGSMLGAGGFGVTYTGYDLNNNRRIAIKEFMPAGMVRRKPGERTVHITSNQGMYVNSMERFLEEARMIYRYQNNSHILQVYSLFKENNTAYYIMEFLEGTDLKNLLGARGGRMSWQELFPITMQLIDALTVLHKDGIVHRDISPDNIFVGKGLKTTLIDFGASRTYMAQKQLTVILKRRYAPIEQYDSKEKQGPWTDIYALAATLYHCLTGYLPPESTERIHMDELKSFRQLGVMLEPCVENAIYKAMSVKVQDRFKSTIEFRDSILGRVKTATMTAVQGIYLNAKIDITDLLTVGRNVNACQLVYPGTIPGVSGVHFQIRPVQNGQGVEIKDMNSTYGTWINGGRIPAGSFIKLSDGDMICIGGNQIWRIEY